MHIEPGPTHRRQRPGDVPPVEPDLRVARAAAEEGRTIVLVEGLSDKAAMLEMIAAQGDLARFDLLSGVKTRRRCAPPAATSIRFLQSRQCHASYEIPVG
jgi:hypothetical protein